MHSKKLVTNLNRTAAACGFRWNAVVRHQYETELKQAKKERKEKLRILGKDYRRRGNGIYLAKPQESGERAPSVPISALSIDIIIAYLVQIATYGFRYFEISSSSYSFQ